MAQREAWLAQQAYACALHALERHGKSRHDALMAKANLAVLAESVLTRLCRIAGGGAYSRNSLLGFWFEDVRGAGFLRPPWSVALEGLCATGRETTYAAGASLPAMPEAGSTDTGTVLVLPQAGSVLEFVREQLESLGSFVIRCGLHASRELWDVDAGEPGSV